MPGSGWARRVRWATAFTLARPGDWLPALAGFLVRGGIVPLLVPILVLPSPVAIAANLDVNALSEIAQARATDPRTWPLWLVALVVVAAAAIMLWLFAAGFIGAAVDAALVRIAAGGRTEPRGIDRGEAIDQVTIRGLFLLPWLIVAIAAAVEIGPTIYSELVNPSTLTTPFVQRIVQRMAPWLSAVVVTWVICEGLAALAVRYELRDRAGVARAVRSALGHAVRRPLTTVLTIAVTFLASVAVIAVPLAAAIVAFDWCRAVARSDPMPFTLSLFGISTTRDARPLAVFLSAVVLAATWLLVLAAAAATSAWRSHAFTAEAAGADSRTSG